MPDHLMLSDAVRASFQPIIAVLPSIRQELAELPDVVTVRPGYRYPPSGDPVASALIAVVPGTEPVDAAALATKFEVSCAAVDASVEEQLAHSDEGLVAFDTSETTASALERMLGAEIVEFRPPVTGSYEPLVPPDLPLVDEEMTLTICVSPEAGWSELEPFLAATKKRLTVAMYQFTAPHIFEAVFSALAPEGRKLQLVMHPYFESPPLNGVKANDLETETEVLQPLSQELTQRYKFAKATFRTNANPDGLWGTSYHIKVAVRDERAVWLSSGNWQSSNQPDVHLFGTDLDPEEPLPQGFPNEFNRDYHAVIENRELAKIFEKYIERDFELSAEQAAAPVEFAAEVELFVPETVELPVGFGEGGKFFEPLRVERKVKVQPLLTPDNYAEHVLDLIESAEESLWFQNQYIKLRGTGEDFPELTQLVSALKAKIDAGLEVRIICRDLMNQADLDVLIANEFPRDVFRFQKGCHNKTIIVDKKIAMVGSHNWSNEGVATNRDASLIFHDRPIAEYLAKVYDDDWNFRADDHPMAVRARVARPGEAAPPGFVVVPMSTFLDE